MFWKKTKLYTVHIKPTEKASEILEQAELVQEGFRWLAFLFPALWSLFHKMWGIAILLFVTLFTIEILHELEAITPHTAFISKFTIQILMGFSGDDLYRRSLKRRGYIFHDIVSGTDKTTAQLRFLERYA